MNEADEIERLSKSAQVVIFHSPLTDLGGLDHELNRRGKRWNAVEMAMGDPRNRDRYDALRHFTGQTTLPQVFIDGRFVGGIRSAREVLRHDENAAANPGSLMSAAAVSSAAVALLPFIGLAAWLWVYPSAQLAARLLAVYGGIALAVIGSIHFGWALGEHAEEQRFWWSALPPLAGWILAVLPVGIALPLLAAAHAVTWFGEWRWFSGTFPAWYRHLRAPMSWLATASLLAAWIARLLYGA